MNPSTRRHLRRSITILIICAIGAGGAFAWYRTTHQSPQPVRYVLTPVHRGTITVAVRGSGQVAPVQQLDVRPKLASTVRALLMREGQLVRAGQPLLTLDTRDLTKTIRDAETNLESARLALEKIKRPPDAVTLLDAEHARDEAQEAETRTASDLQKAYVDAFTAIANAFLDLPAIMTGLQDTLYSNAAGSPQWHLDAYTDAMSPYEPRAIQYRNDVDTKYQAARRAYEAAFAEYKTTEPSASTAAIAKLLTNTTTTVTAITDAIKSANNLIQLSQDRRTERHLTPIATSSAHLAALNSSTGKLYTHSTNLRAAATAITNAQRAIVTAQRTTASRAATLAKLHAGPDALDIRTQELVIRQREQVLRDARDALADASVLAPMDGMIVEIPVRISDTVNSATTIATMIAVQRIATITVNEVDVAKLRVDQPATLTFDAITDLTISGRVARIDTLGTTTQGVVGYGVDLALDTTDERVRPGMSVSAAIITDAHTDILQLPNAAIQVQGDRATVSILEDMRRGTPNPAGVPARAAPQRIPVTIGLTNDDMTEIQDGLQEGDLVVTQTIDPNTTRTTNRTATPANNGLRLFGAPTGGARIR
ncbi:efflux RND transporter periplasmic adaptor subunit [Candidatus Uhrbacteria bacterium]|nr:efflux RND transporter periplasmic adaptor subunit [Candidatus Uhrbacteria bacterium]